jgi:hypothetical protein
MSDMLKLLKIVDKVEKPVAINEAVSLSINATGESACDVTDMFSKIMQLSGMKQVTPDMMPHADANMPMVKSIQSVGGYADQAAKKFVDDVGEEMSGGYDSTDTELDHEVTDNPGDIDDVTMKTAGGLNGPHKQYKKEYPGDNPLAENLSAKLMQEYQGIKVK